MRRISSQHLETIRGGFLYIKKTTNKQKKGADLVWMFVCVEVYLCITSTVFLRFKGTKYCREVNLHMLKKYITFKDLKCVAIVRMSISLTQPCLQPTLTTLWSFTTRQSRDVPLKQHRGADKEGKAS